MRHHFNVELEDESEEYRYLAACARIRGIRMQALLRRLIEAIGQGQLVLGVLDDDSERVLRKGEYRDPEYLARGGKRK